MDFRTNAGFIITNSMTVGETEIVLGVHEKNHNSFVTWQCKNKTDFFWGRYFTDMLSAQKDFCKRTLDEVKYLEGRTKPPRKKEPER